MGARTVCVNTACARVFSYSVQISQQHKLWLSVSCIMNTVRKWGTGTNSADCLGGVSLLVVVSVSCCVINYSQPKSDREVVTSLLFEAALC